jgi:hypothetical protein
VFPTGDVHELALLTRRRYLNELVGTAIKCGIKGEDL